MGARTPWSAHYNRDWRKMRQIGILAVIIAGLTLIIYPLFYSSLVDVDITGWRLAMRLPVSIVLVCRNAMMVVLLVVLIGWLWNFLGPAGWRHSRSHPPFFAHSEQPTTVSSATARNVH
jgi:hypothetical protein